MLALSSSLEEEGKVGGISRGHRAKSGAGAEGNAAMGALRRMEGSKADDDHGLWRGVDVAFASESKFQILDGGKPRAERFMNGCRLVGWCGGLCACLDIVDFAGMWLRFSSCFVTLPKSC